MTTTHVASIDKIIDTASIRAAIIAMAGNHTDELHILEAVADYRDYLCSLLPLGYTIHGDEIYRETDAEEIDLDDVRERIQFEQLDNGGFDISEYANPDEQPANPDDDLRASRDESRDVAQKAFNIAGGMVTRARRLAARGNASSYRAAAEVMLSANYTYQCAGTTFHWLEDYKTTNLCARFADITSGLSRGYARTADELDKVADLLAKLEP